MLETRDLTFSYPTSSPMYFPDIQCKQGEHWLLLGQSGSGKTTLLHLLGGLLRPSSGTIKIRDTAMEQLSGAALDHFRGRNIGIVFQTAHFVRALNVAENLALAQRLAGRPVDLNRIQELLSRLGLEHKSKSLPANLSVGERQRASIARAIINQPGILLADEPTSALDDHNCQGVLQLLKEQAEAVQAVLLIVTHDNRLKETFDKQVQLNQAVNS